MLVMTNDAPVALHNYSNSWIFLILYGDNHNSLWRRCLMHYKQSYHLHAVIYKQSWMTYKFKYQQRVTHFFLRGSKLEYNLITYNIISTSNQKWLLGALSKVVKSLSVFEVLPTSINKVKRILSLWFDRYKILKLFCFFNSLIPRVPQRIPKLKSTRLTPYFTPEQHSLHNLLMLSAAN